MDLVDNVSGWFPASSVWPHIVPEIPLLCNCKAVCCVPGKYLYSHPLGARGFLGEVARVRETV
jgi:hypothetical protein